MLLSRTLIALLLTTSAHAVDSAAVRGGFSGNWTDPVPNSQGVQIEVIDEYRAVVAWFTYDLSGQPTWLFGTGTLHGNEVRVEMFRFVGGAFPPDETEPSAIETTLWGEVTLSFDDCDNGEMSWQPSLPGYEAGAMRLERLTAIEGLPCGAPQRFERETRFHFDAGAGRWRALFSDYDEEQRELLMTEHGRTRLPPPLDQRFGYRLAGTNRSDDLAMQLAAPVGGLRPDTAYRVEQTMTFATQVPKNCAGVGGSPGESVYIHLGATPIRPEVVENDGRFSLNVGKANQSQDGEDALVVGNMANRQQCEQTGGSTGEWQLKTVSSAGRDFVAETDSSGTLWVFGGSDSGFEARTEFYVTEWVVRLQPVGGG